MLLVAPAASPARPDTDTDITAVSLNAGYDAGTCARVLECAGPASQYTVVPC